MNIFLYIAIEKIYKDFIHIFPAMEIRRVQKTGGASYVITLPKEWVNSHHIQKNDPIGMISQTDGTLLVTSQMSSAQKDREKILNLSEQTNNTHLFRSLIAAYIAGYDTTKITSTQRIKPQIRTTIRNFTQTTIGQEVVEETDTTITIKDLLNPTEMPFDRTIKRMHIIIKNMHEDVLRAIEKNDKKLAQEIIDRDNDIDRLHWLIARQSNIISRNVSLAEKMNVTIESTAIFHLISKIVERIGDHVAKIADNALTIDNQHLTKDLIDNIHTTSDYAMQLFTRSITALLRRDIERANKTIDDAKTLIKKCKELNEYAQQERGENAIRLGYILESTKRIGDYSADISENVINYVIGKDEKQKTKTKKLHQ